jgi:hypothetical protein
MRSGLPNVITLVALALVLSSCAELSEFRDVRSDITHLRSDLNTHAEALAKLSSRLDQLERHGNVSGPSPHDTTQALEVLLKKALETESRLSAIESASQSAKAADKLSKQARPPVAEAKAPAAPKKADQNGPSSTVQAALPAPKNAAVATKSIRLGMTSEEVRRALGDPISTETSQSYIFWHYSQVTHQKYVIFEKDTGQVSGWWGL